MPEKSAYDAVVIGSGPNGLAAAITLARAGRSTLVVEARDTVGGGMRSAALTLPGFVHDVCSAIHPLGIGSPFFQSLPLADYGLQWIHPPSPLAHPFDDGTAALLARSVEETEENLGPDGAAWRKLMRPLVEDCAKLMGDLLGPLGLPRHPLAMMRFGLRAMRSATGLAKSRFQTERARGLFAGLAAHSILPLDYPMTASFGLMLGLLGHAVGWPLPRGGSQKLAEAMAAYFRSLGGEVLTGMKVEAFKQLPPARAVLFDTTPRQLLRIAGDRLPASYKRRLEKFRHGPGAFKLDLALDGPIPWKAPECARAATVHLGPTLEEIAASERAAWEDKPPEKPYVLLAQQSLFDPARAPEGKHTAWAYCHVPNGSTFDMTGRILSQIERFAPGFRDRILACHATSPAGFEQYNENYIGGDITGGANTLGQLFTRPVARLSPYATPDRSIYLCSASTPPGGGVHGMCGYYAALAALRRAF